MLPSLVLAVAQPRCVPLDVAANLHTHAAVVRSADARVVVFPELSATGYELDAPAIASDDPRLEPLVAACATAGAIALVGAPVPGVDGGRSLGVLAVDAAGTTVAYRKVWLSAGERDAGLLAGDGPAVVTVDGWRLGLAVCRDTGVPQHAANAAALGIDVYVAGIVHGADEVTEHVDRAGRIVRDHGVWVAIASAAGPAGRSYPETAGRSAIWDPHGRCRASCGPSQGEVAMATLTG